MSSYEPVIGLEIHAQLLTATKIFCGCPDDVRRAAEHARLPGVPRISGRAAGAQSRRRRFRRARRAGARLRRAGALGLRAQELLLSRPAEGLSDLAVPSCRWHSGGGLDIAVDGTAQARAADAHPHGRGRGQVAARGLCRFRSPDLSRLQPRGRAAHRDRQRAGPAIVRPKRRRSSRSCARFSSGSASTTATWKRAACAATPTSRFAASARRRSGTKAEVKNVNSFRYLQKALEYEIERQIDVVEHGGRVVQETRLFDSAQGRTYSMRSKEEAHDYRYFPGARSAAARRRSSAATRASRRTLPELPEARMTRFVREYGAARLRRRPADADARARRLLRGDGARRRAIPRQRATGSWASCCGR